MKFKNTTQISTEFHMMIKISVSHYKNFTTQHYSLILTVNDDPAVDLYLWLVRLGIQF